MYSVIRQLDGKYRAVCEIQDGTEQDVHDTKEAAIKSVILGAKVMNGTKIARKQIRFGHEEQVVRTIVIEDLK